MNETLSAFNISELKKTDSEFFVEVDNRYKAHITYTDNDGKYTIDHCEVPPELRGKGIGKDLVKKTFDFLNKENAKVDIHCSYVKKVVKEENLY